MTDGATLALIAALALVQSLFGMGVLVFGTPTLLLLGFAFPEALGWLLPAWLAISIAQVAGERDRARALFRGGRPLLCLVPLAAALAVVLLGSLALRIDRAVGVAMIGAACARLLPAVQRRLGEAVSRHERLYLAVMGVVHGLTNMGGALLSVYATSVNSDKHAIRTTIAAYYCCFAAVQLSVLAALRPETLGWHSIAAAGIGAIVYGAIGRRVFGGLTSLRYGQAMTSFLAVYGAAVLVRSTL